MPSAHTDPAPGLPSPLTRRFQVYETIERHSIFSRMRAWDHVEKRQVWVFLFSQGLTQKYAGLAAEMQRQLSCNMGLSHPLIVRTHTVIEYNDTPVFAEDIAAGPSLYEVLEERRRHQQPFSLKEAVGTIAHLCAALHYAHRYTSHGLIHPGEIFLGDMSDYGKVPRIAHFGIRSALRMTGSGCAGLPPALEAYASPEFLDGAPVTAETDVYGLGALLYEMLTLRPPTGCFIPPGRIHPEGSPALDRVLLRSLEEFPALRHRSVEGLARDLSRLAGLNWEDILRVGQIAQGGFEGVPLQAGPFVRYATGSTIAWLLLLFLNALLLLSSVSGRSASKVDDLYTMSRAEEWEEFFRKAMAQEDEVPLSCNSQHDWLPCIWERGVS